MIIKDFVLPSGNIANRFFSFSPFFIYWGDQQCIVTIAESKSTTTPAFAYSAALQRTRIPMGTSPKKPCPPPRPPAKKPAGKSENASFHRDTRPCLMRRVSCPSAHRRRPVRRGPCHRGHGDESGSGLTSRTRDGRSGTVPAGGGTLTVDNAERRQRPYYRSAAG